MSKPESNSIRIDTDAKFYAKHTRCNRHPCHWQPVHIALFSALVRLAFGERDRYRPVKCWLERL